ncbi:MAG: S-layer homology domain-containing protein [Oscillospiraceae bacterium]|nr:S-layer homology domain-containing protein [Oscillospiraceae bacterium]
MKKILAVVLSLAMTLALIPVIGLAVPPAEMLETRVFSQNLVGIDYAPPRLDYGILGYYDTPSNSNAVLDGRWTGSGLNAQNQANRHRMFFMTFDLTEIMANLDDISEIRISLQATLTNTASHFNAYMFTPELAALINFDDIPTYGAARDLGLIDYRDNLIWTQQGIQSNIAITSPDILPYILDYLDQNPGETVIGFSFLGTSQISPFYNAEASNAAQRPQLIVSTYITDQFVNNALAAIDLGDLSAVTRDLTLPSEINGIPLRWESSNQNFLRNSGRVDRPVKGEGNVTVQLTASAELNGQPFTRVFNVTILYISAPGPYRPWTLRDPQHMSDEAFFGVWDSSLNGGAGGWVPQPWFNPVLAAGTWINIMPVLRYDLFPDLRYVLAAVKLGDYYTAREELLIYYRNRNPETAPPYNFPNRRNDMAAIMASEKIMSWTQTDAPVGVANIGSQWAWHTIDLDMSHMPTHIPQIPRTLFLLDSDMDGSAVEIRSREFGTGQYAAELVLVVDGVSQTFPVHADVAIKASDMEWNPIFGSYVPADNNSITNFGSDEIMLVRETAGIPVIRDGIEIPMPFGSNTSRPYFHFNTWEVTGNVTSAQLRIFARTDSGADKRIFAFLPGNTQIYGPGRFMEHTFTWSPNTMVNPRMTGHTPMVFNMKETGYVWDLLMQSPWQLEFEWLNVNARLLPVDWLIEKYHRTGDNLYAFRALEFVMSLYTQQPRWNWPRVLESGWRAEQLCTLILGTLHSDMMTPEILTALLKYTYSHVGPNGMHFDLSGSAFGHVPPMQLVPALRVMGHFPEIQMTGAWDMTKRNLLNTHNRNLNPDGSHSTSASYTWIYRDLRELAVAIDLIRWYAEPDEPIYLEMLAHFRGLARYMFNMTMNPGFTVPWGSAGNRNEFFRLAYELSRDFPFVDPDGFFEYAHTQGVRGMRPYWTSALYPDKAIAFLRSGWERNDFSAMISATHGGSFSHPDDLALDVFAFGRALLIEAGEGSHSGIFGTGIYNQTWSHNTITINNGNQIRHGGDVMFNQPQKLLLATNGIFDFVEAGSNRIWPRHRDWDDNWQAGFEQHRKVLFIHNRFWIVSDYIFPDDDEPHLYRQVWRPDQRNNLTIDPLTGTMRTFFGPGSANIQVVPADPTEITARVDRNWGVGPYGEEITDFVSYLRTDHVGPATFDTLLFPDPAGQRTFVQVERIPLGVPSYVATALRIDIGTNIGFYYSANDFDPGFPPPIPNVPQPWVLPNRMRWTPPDWRETELPTRTFDLFTTNAQMAYIEIDRHNHPTMIALTKASFIESGEEMLFESDERIADLGIVWEHRILHISTESDEIPAGIRIRSERRMERVNHNGMAVSFTQEDDIITIGDSHIDIPSIQVVGDLDFGQVPFGSPQPAARTVTVTNTGNVPVEVFLSGRGSGSGHVGSPFIQSSFQVENPLPPGGVATFTVRPIVGLSVGVHSDIFSISAIALNTNLESASPPAFPVIKNIPIRIEITEQSPPNGFRPPPPVGPPNNQRPNIITPPSTPPISGNNDNNPFTDINGHWARNEILAMHARGVVNGTGGGLFQPDNNITRAEFAAILVRALGLPQNYNGNSGEIFNDVAASDWFADVVAVAFNAGLVAGFDDGNFRPNSIITRQEMAVMLMRAWEVSGFETVNSADLSMFADASEIADWAAPAVATAVGAGLMTGVGSNEFSPQTHATRAQATVVISRLLELGN